MTTPAPARTDLRAQLGVEVQQTAELVLSIAPAGGPGILEEELSCRLDGAELRVEEVVDLLGSRLHVLRGVPAGALSIDYHARVAGSAPTLDFTPADEIIYRRPSRYAESDKLGVIAHSLFAGLSGQELIAGVTKWVSSTLRYVPGASQPTDGAVDTFLAGQGICRDYAHLTIAMLRACGLPARLVSVYAPGLAPMDFHAITEVALDGRWQVVDATRLAPRAAMIRIATGQDASDTAFLTVLSGRVSFGTVTVTCVAEGELPAEDPQAVVRL